MTALLLAAELLGALLALLPGSASPCPGAACK
jgi:hypothetical protein